MSSNIEKQDCVELGMSNMEMKEGVGLGVSVSLSSSLRLFCGRGSLIGITYLCELPVLQLFLKYT